MDGMSYSSRQQRKPPLVRYSTPNRATLLSSINSMPQAKWTRAASKRPRQKRSQATNLRRRGGSASNKLKIIKGNVVVKVVGYPGTHRFGASQLIRFVPLNKVKQAAKCILVSSRRGRIHRQKIKKNRRNQKRRARG
jgi:hypothetical protein